MSGDDKVHFDITTNNSERENHYIKQLERGKKCTKRANTMSLLISVSIYS